MSIEAEVSGFSIDDLKVLSLARAVSGCPALRAAPRAKLASPAKPKPGILIFIFKLNSLNLYKSRFYG